MMEKRNIIEDGRTPSATEKTAQAVDGAVGKFKRKVDPNADTSEQPAVPEEKKEKDDAGKTSAG
jgi:hypothetical protein